MREPQVVGLAQGPCSSDSTVINLLSATPIGFIKQQAHAGIQYEVPLSGGGSLTPRFDVTYQGPQNGSNSATVAGTPTALYGQVASFTVANAHLEWRNAKKDLSARLEATNLFNKYYFYSKFDLSGLAGTITRLARAAVWLGTDREEELLIRDYDWSRKWGRARNQEPTNASISRQTKGDRISGRPFFR